MHRQITGKLVIATHNPGKLAEMRELLAPHGVEAVSAGELAQTALRLGTFLVGLVVFGLLLIPRFIRMVVALDRPEITTVTAIGLGFGGAYLAASF